MFADYNSYWTQMYWEMNKESIYNTRKTYGPSFYRNMEYAMNALEKYWKEHPELAP
jgi:hypothetical protein